MIIEVFLLLEVFVMTFFCLGFFFKKEFLWALSIIANLIALFSMNNIVKLIPTVFEGEVVTALSYVDVNGILIFNAILLVAAGVLGILDFADNDSFKYSKLGAN